MITQKIDKGDDILGAYHEWARAIAGSFDKFSVVCLYEGKNDLPKDIKVFSLGKENGECRVKYLKNFYRYIWGLRSEYDAVFVHMNPIYVLLGWVIWRICHKKIYLWFAHPAWNWKVKLAYILSDRVITSVPEAFYRKGKKVVAIGQGIDTGYFRNEEGKPRYRRTILYLGRVSPSKNIHVLVEALYKLKKAGIPFNFYFVGSPPDMPGAYAYAQKIKSMIQGFKIEDVTTSHDAVPYGETTNWYGKSEIFVNLSPTGHFDKTVLEAMSSGCITLASNNAYIRVFPPDLHEFLIFKQGDAGDLAGKLKKVLELPEDKKEEIRKHLREVVVKNHSLYTLGERILEAISSK